MFNDHFGPKHMSYRFSKIKAVVKENEEFKSFDQIGDSFWATDYGLTSMFFQLYTKKPIEFTFKRQKPVEKLSDESGTYYRYFGIFTDKNLQTTWEGPVTIAVDKMNLPTEISCFYDGILISLYSTK